MCVVCYPRCCVSFLVHDFKCGMNSYCWCIHKFKEGIELVGRFVAVFPIVIYPLHF